ncbi:retrotransposon protein, putative, ty1-copia subclass [Tanacetum coccineum]
MRLKWRLFLLILEIVGGHLISAQRSYGSRLFEELELEHAFLQVEGTWTLLEPLEEKAFKGEVENLVLFLEGMFAFNCVGGGCGVGHLELKGSVRIGWACLRVVGVELEFMLVWSSLVEFWHADWDGVRFMSVADGGKKDGFGGRWGGRGEEGTNAHKLVPPTYVWVWADWEGAIAVICGSREIRAIRILLAIAAFYDYEIWQMDVKTAFLNGHLSEDVYMVQPEGFVDPKHPNKVCKLQRSIYGLKQASRSWKYRFDATTSPGGGGKGKGGRKEMEVGEMGRKGRKEGEGDGRGESGGGKGGRKGERGERGGKGRGGGRAEGKE